jgi:hypothetical protein
MTTEKHKVLSWTNLPVKLPVFNTIVCLLVLDRFNAPEWVWGIMGTILCFVWVVLICVKFNEERVKM